MIRSYQLTLAGAAKRVSDVYGVTAEQLPAADISYRSITFQSESAAVQLGMNDQVSATVYGVSIATGTIYIVEPAAPGSPLHLSDFWAFGNATLHILGVVL